MQAGTLRYHMAIEQKGSTRTATGSVQETWSTVAKVWGGFEELTGRELEAAQKIVADATSKVTIRYVAGIVPEMRLNWFDRAAKITVLLDILNASDPERRHRSLELLCREHQIGSGSAIIAPGAQITAPLPYGRKGFTGTIDGVNTVFTLPSAPDITILQIIYNGLILSPPSGYTINGNQVTFAIAPKPAQGQIPADEIFAYY
jgi:SPP1 family predicted phage head-tail adaptor